MEITEKMLQENGINDAKVTSVEGFFSDQNDLVNKTTNLRLDV